MRTMVKAVVLLLAVAFLAGLWQQRYGEEARPGRSSAPFRTAPATRSHSPRTAPELLSVATAERDGHDRVTFTFQGAAPGWRVRYVPKVAGSGGGQAVPLDGEAFLEVTFEPARARDTAGRPTFPDGDIGPGAVSIRQVRFAGDFEGEVRFGIGVAGRDGFRVVEQGDPTRVAVDVR
ncbi:MAG TPA: hypothetical protein VHK02_10595 [Actinomycetota bacterium]|nr:hypothetical protein [Actinomycetota bacterium]